MVAVHFDVSAVGVLFFEVDLEKNFGVGYLLASLRWDVVVVDNKESISSWDEFPEPWELGMMPWQRLLSLLDHYLFQTSWCFGCLRIFRYSSDLPVLEYITVWSQWLRNSEGCFLMDYVAVEIRLAVELLGVASLYLVR